MEKYFAVPGKCSAGPGKYFAVPEKYSALHGKIFRRAGKSSAVHGKRCLKYWVFGIFCPKGKWTGAEEYVMLSVNVMKKGQRVSRGRGFMSYMNMDGFWPEVEI